MKSVCPLTRIIALALACGAIPVYANGASSIVRGSVQVTVYDGITDDLLSAGLNQAGLVVK